MLRERLRDRNGMAGDDRTERRRSDLVANQLRSNGLGWAARPVQLQSSELSATDLREGVVRFSGGNLEQFSDELCLRHDVVTADVSNLPLPHHCHCLIACQRSSSRPEAAKAKSRAG